MLPVTWRLNSFFLPCTTLRPGPCTPKMVEFFFRSRMEELMMMVALAQKYSNDSSTTQSQQQLLQNWHSYEIKAVILAYFLLLLLEKTCELKTSKNSQFEKWSIFQLHSKVEFPCDVTFDIYFILKPWQISLKSNPAYLNLIRKSRCPKLKACLNIILEIRVTNSNFQQSIRLWTSTYSKNLKISQKPNLTYPNQIKK